MIQESSLIEIDSKPDTGIKGQLPIDNDDIQIVESSLETSKNNITSVSKPNKIIKQNVITNKKKSKSTVEDMFIKKLGTTNTSSFSFPRRQMAQCPIFQDFFLLRILERTHLDEYLNLRSLSKLPKTNNKISISKTKSDIISFPKKISTPVSQLSTMTSKRDKSSSPSYISNSSINYSSNLNSSPHYKDKIQEKEKISYVSEYANSFANKDKRQILPKLGYSNLLIHQPTQKK